jgi:hypothetical protein
MGPEPLIKAVVEPVLSPDRDREQVFHPGLADLRGNNGGRPSPRAPLCYIIGASRRE